MAKYDDTTQVIPPTTEYLDSHSQALVEALTAAILSARRDVPPPDPAATAAAAQYREIKGALRTHSEPILTPIPTPSTGYTSKG